jgi:ribosome biogenesis protein ENP2
MSNDGQYILATGVRLHILFCIFYLFPCLGTYKPRLRCYDVRDLSMKFERCVDAEIVKLLVLSDGFEKVRVCVWNVIFLYAVSTPGRRAIHRVAFTKWALLSCTYATLWSWYVLLFTECGVDCLGEWVSWFRFVFGFIFCYSRDIYRLNLEHGRFMTPFTSCAQSTTSCAINPHHYLLITGTDDVRYIFIILTYSHFNT